MSLQVEVIDATNVPNPETVGKCDPYATIEFQGLKKKTEVIKGELNPKWNQKFEFDLAGRILTKSDEIIVSIFDWERVGRNRLLGTAKISLLDFTRGGSVTKSFNINLSDANQRPTLAVVNLRIAYIAPPGQSKAPESSISQGIVVNTDDTDSEDDAEDEPAADGPPQLDASGQPVKTSKKTRKRQRLRPNLSKKPSDFQIRVKVTKARQLQGANVNPVTRVTVSNQSRQTRVKKSTSVPEWNESFFFNFHSAPSELFDELVEFKVFNSKRLRSDALIGSFKFDIGLVYDEPQHALLNKWLLLSDPEDSMAGHKGYLKVSVVIVGPGDEAPSMKGDEKEEEEDVESNLLRPSGMQMRPAMFVLRVYRAEDIPRMDSAFLEGVKKVFNVGEEKKELVDPYFVFSFAGKEVKTKIMYCCDHPEWNQELRLGLHFPSMCERIKFMIKDWDRVTEDDIVGTSLLPVSLISSSGELDTDDSDTEEQSYLPTFGPSYINFYGSTREYSDLPDEYQDLNEGKGEGVAYRGRALLELTTVLGENETGVADIENDVILRVQKYMRRRKYRVHAAFLDATMISAIDAPVEFEISIGNYGNKLDENVPPCASTTQPTNAVFDGCKYYYLPWGGTKPCVVVDCSFEDISFRLESLNVLVNIIHNLESNIERVRIGIKAKLPMPEIAQLLISLLDQLITDCKKPLPEPRKGVHVDNELDRLMRKQRVEELASISDMALKLRESATDVTEALSDVETYLQILNNMAIEPQNSMPDVIIWMISGQKRIAYYRIPANEIFFSSDPVYRGKNCGKLQTIQLNTPSTKSKEKNMEIPALLRMKLWLGLQTEENQWHKIQSEGELAVFAETYENQVNVLGTWTNKGPTMTRPKWSDSQGKMELPKEQFVPPPGWRWDSEWYVSPELSMLYDKDAGHNVFVEDLYECHSRNIPGGTWGPATRPWADVKGDQMLSRQDLKPPEGWEWVDDWQVDLGRAVDEDGWEYCVEATVGGYGPVEKTYHLCRRRRWMRTRKNVSGVKKQQDKKEKQMTKAAEGWEYAPLFNMKFHAMERTMDLVRRRRWHRKMVAEDPHASCFFSVKLDKSEGKDQSMTAPRMFLTFQSPVKYQLRAYIYQARDLLAGDDTGLSDPFAQVCFLTQSMVTEKVQKTLCPTWDQTLIFGEIEIYGNPKGMESNPPDIYIEIFDHDTFGKPEFLGRTKAQPMVKLDPADARTPVLQWYDIKRSSQQGGELLAAFELFMLTGKDLPFLPPKRGSLYLVPNGIRPVMQRTGIEVLCWGVRNMKKYQLANVNSPSIHFECGGNVRESAVLRNAKKNPNFDNPLLFFDVMLPKEELYMPPMNIRVIDHRNFGRHPTVGVHVLKTLEEFRNNPLQESNADANLPGNGPTTGGDHVIDMPEQEKRGMKESHKPSIFQRNLDFPRFQLPVIQLSGVKEQPSEAASEEIDWWSKYHASSGETDKCRKYLELGYYKIKLYRTELEKAEYFSNFSDFCNTFELSRGKDEEEEDNNNVGEFKGTFRVYPLPQDPSEPLPPPMITNLPPSSPEECLVRVYVVSALELQPNDPTGLADPYIEIALGKKKMNSRDNYIPNTIDPVFGRLFEMTAVLPLDKDLIIRVKDYDLVTSDDLIGETSIDLENRYLSRYRATCGIPQYYIMSGINMWRDSQKPKQILENYCQKNRLSGPMFYSNDSVKVGQRVYNLTEFERDQATSEEMGPKEERLALHVLNTLPIVKEHVEARPLFNPLQPGIEQGKLHLWVDIFPKSLGPPGPPFDITPRKAKKYVLRCVIWNTVDVILDEESITGEKMSDIYVVGWMAGIDQKQKTDVHYRSLNGEGNFNWRFVFPFEYMVAEKTMVVKKKEHFWSLDETELRTAPILMIQIWDNDKFSADDFLGTLQLNLSSMPSPAKRSSACKLSQLPDNAPNANVKTVSLFEAKRLCGFWPCYNDDTGERVLTGKVEMELELVTESEAEQRPAGKGREDPNMNPTLEEPKRPATSFLWFTSPLKTLRYIIWHNYKWVIIGFLVLALILLLVFLFIYSFPGEISRWMVGNSR
ncbi:myoferlin-like isoform X4 [Pomacea canaliculata]|uniref:myoferlin-like isoform X4 n=1 Tax=Pomacea canaliculata TaxID=400727 RepID=UPI000D735ED3|nr:myoferlin-like isoform X4 [Pomacea canaliculata]